MRRSYLRIRRNRTHNGRPYPRERAPERDGGFAPEGEPRTGPAEGDADERAVAADLFPRRERD
jgi:hypothetical protein